MKKSKLKKAEKSRRIVPAPIMPGERGHVAYTRIRRGKLERIPAKGTVLKEREYPKTEVSDKQFSKLLDSYFQTQDKVKTLKEQIMKYEKEMSEVMDKIRPYLAKMDNLEKEENKFKTEFDEGGWRYRFLQFTRETKPYKDLYIRAFNMLTEIQKKEMEGLEKALSKITVQEKFEREMKKAEANEEISEDKIEIADRLKRLALWKEIGVKLLELFFGRK